MEWGGISRKLPDNVEHIYPDYGLYGIEDTAYGFLTRGCPRGCDFCIVAEKEGRKSVKVADLSEWWSGQKKIVLMDPNILACRDHLDLLGQLAESRAYVDVNQGLDARLLNKSNIAGLNRVRMKNVHFAWDKMKDSRAVLRGLELYAGLTKNKPHGSNGTVYVLTNFDTTIEDDLFRVYTLRGMNYDPYIMVFEKESAPRDIRRLQRWCNNKIIFKSCMDFKDYDDRSSDKRLTKKDGGVGQQTIKLKKQEG